MARVMALAHDHLGRDHVEIGVKLGTRRALNTVIRP